MGSIDDTLIEKANWHWRNSMRPVRFFALDARAAIPFLILLVYIRPISLLMTVVVTGMFLFLERRGLTFDSALRTFRSWINGQKRPPFISYRVRTMKDYG